MSESHIQQQTADMHKASPYRGATVHKYEEIAKLQKVFVEIFAESEIISNFAHKEQINSHYGTIVSHSK